MIKIVNKADCCGCTACMAVCPNNCIEMKDDIEGFKYPSVDIDKCIHCNQCNRVCPIQKPSKQEERPAEVYFVQSTDESIRASSTSGGAFTALAEYVISKNGVVFGVAFKDSDSWEVIHTVGVDKKEIEKFRGSKYVQSDMGNCLAATRDNLMNNRLVLFSGTPCQIAGLKRYLGKEYSNLITVDVVCRAVPSPFVWSKYVELYKNKYGHNIERFRFRDKVWGYSYSTMSIYMKKGSKKKDYHRGIESDLWMRMFFSGLITRPSCNTCPYREDHVSDFTIWDCFNVKKFVPEFDDNSGTTRMTINSTKGINLFNMIKDKYRYKVKIQEGNSSIEKAYEEKIDLRLRENFFEDLHCKPVQEVFNEYMPYTLKIMMLQYGRMITYRVGLYKWVKQIWDRIKNRGK